MSLVYYVLGTQCIYRFISKPVPDTAIVRIEDE